MGEGGSYYRLITGSGEEVSKKLAEYMLKVAQECIDKKGYFTSGLAGGRSPKKAYRIFKELFPYWENSFFFPTDERYVPPEDPRNNCRMLRETLGERAKIYRVRTELPIREACEDFGKKLSEVKCLDFILLGLGTDGHTASLFPESPCAPCGKNACISTSPDGLLRISMSLEFINRSSQIAFIVLGEEKRGVLNKLLGGEDIPAVRVKNGKEIKIFTDLLPAARFL